MRFELVPLKDELILGDSLMVNVAEGIKRVLLVGGLTAPDAGKWDLPMTAKGCRPNSRQSRIE